MPLSSSGAVNRGGLTVHSRDALSEEGAHALARRIEAYWHRQGYPEVRAWAEPVSAALDANPNAATSRIWCIRTNLSGGLPPAR